uniref:PPIase cyclophilin-type domain-containing protein n=1 Tax=Panagrolaimus sp. ES5 TaxID=591445 RepID=A0AC34FM06_9BILA
MTLCRGTKELGKTTGKVLTYKGCTVHRIKGGKIIETGDFSHNDGTGGESIYGGTFEDENFEVPHKEYMLSMVNQGQPNTNGSQFAFTIFGEPDLDGKNVAFGKVLQGTYILDEIRKIPVDKNSKPIADIVIMDCGILNKDKEDGELTTTTSSSSSTNDVIFEKEVRRSPSVEIIENEVPKRRRLQVEDMPKFYERENPLHRNDFGKHRRHTVGNSPSRKEENRSRKNTERKVKGRGIPRYEPYSKSNIPSPSYWKAEKQRIIPMKDAKELINRKQEETKVLFNEMTDQAERKKQFSIYHPEHVEARKTLRNEAEVAEKEQERYFGYENSYGPSTSSKFHHSNQETSSSTPQYDLPYGYYPTPTNLSPNENNYVNNDNNFGRLPTNDVVTGMKNIHIQSIPLPPSPYPYQLNENDAITGIIHTYIQFPPPPPPPPLQPPSSEHFPRFAYKQPRQFFF